MVYPLLFHPIHKERIWGGRKLADKYKRELGGKRIGESWEISCHANGQGIISNGPLKGTSLNEAIKKYGKELLGGAVYNDSYKKFPLLIKILDASDILSVQVHPNDDYAFIRENGELGKTEMWYVIDAKQGAKLVYGIKSGTTKAGFKRCVDENRLSDCLRELEVFTGDVVYIPSGMVHAIGEGILICEIQQNSDTTYRVYDWNRVDSNGCARELHLEKAMDVIDFDGKYTKGKLSGLSIHEEGGERIIYTASSYFAMEKLIIESSMKLSMDGERFQTLTFIEGNGEIIYDKGHSLMVSQGSSCLIPAVIRDLVIKGQCTVIRAYVPDKEKNIIMPLLDRGYKKSELECIAGLFD